MTSLPRQCSNGLDRADSTFADWAQLPSAKPPPYTCCAPPAPPPKSQKRFSQRPRGADWVRMQQAVQSKLYFVYTDLSILQVHPNTRYTLPASPTQTPMSEGRRRHTDLAGKVALPTSSPNTPALYDRSLCESPEGMFDHDGGLTGGRREEETPDLCVSPISPMSAYTEPQTPSPRGTHYPYEDEDQDDDRLDVSRLSLGLVDLSEPFFAPEHRTSDHANEQPNDKGSFGRAGYDVNIWKSDGSKLVSKPSPEEFQRDFTHALPPPESTPKPRAGVVRRKAVPVSPAKSDNDFEIHHGHHSSESVASSRRAPDRIPLTRSRAPTSASRKILSRGRNPLRIGTRPSSTRPASPSQGGEDPVSTASISSASPSNKDPPQQDQQLTSLSFASPSYQGFSHQDEQQRPAAETFTTTSAFRRVSHSRNGVDASAAARASAVSAASYSAPNTPRLGADSKPSASARFTPRADPSTFNYDELSKEEYPELDKTKLGDALDDFLEELQVDQAKSLVQSATAQVALRPTSTPSVHVPGSDRRIASTPTLTRPGNTSSLFSPLVHSPGSDQKTDPLGTPRRQLSFAGEQRLDASGRRDPFAGQTPVVNKHLLRSPGLIRHNSLPANSRLFDTVGSGLGLSLEPFTAHAAQGQGPSSADGGTSKAQREQPVRLQGRSDMIKGRMNDSPAGTDIDGDVENHASPHSARAPSRATLPINSSGSSPAALVSRGKDSSDDWRRLQYFARNDLWATDQHVLTHPPASCTAHGQTCTDCLNFAYAAFELRIMATQIPPEDRQKIINNNRSIRTIKNELDNLFTNGVIGAEHYSSMMSLIPGESSLNSAPATSRPTPEPAASSLTNAMANTTLYTATPEHPPNYHSTGPPNLPTRAQVPVPEAEVARAKALYRYDNPEDCRFEVGDIISVTKYMNAEWWFGRNTRTGVEGVFPVSYVEKLVENNPMGLDDHRRYGAEKVGFGSPVPQNSFQQPPYQQQGYGQQPYGAQNQNPYNNSVPPMAVAAQPTDSKTGKGSEMGKKVGKKLGNAAIFGAGATIGSNIVNSIF